MSFIVLVSKVGGVYVCTLFVYPPLPGIGMALMKVMKLYDGYGKPWIHSQMKRKFYSFGLFLEDHVSQLT